MTETSTCLDCGHTAPFEEFPRVGTSKNARYRSYCRPCWRKRSNRYVKKRRNRIYAQIGGYLCEHPCVDCGETDIVVLEFDHVRGKKIGAVSHLAQGRSWDTVAAEIEKCEVVCCNCHRRRTAERAGYYRFVVEPTLSS